MLKRLIRRNSEETQPANQATIRRLKAKLSSGSDPDACARALGALALEYNDCTALLALFEALCETRHPAELADPCAYTVGRVLRETTDPGLVDVGFDIFRRSTSTGVDVAVDKMAFTVAEVALRAKEEKTRQRAREFIHECTRSSDPVVRRCYTYSQHRIAR